MNKEIKAYSIEGLTDLIGSFGLPAFRVKQLFQWLYVHHVNNYDEMTNLPAVLREELAASHPLFNGRIVDRQVSQDGTRKYIIEYHDGARVETVAIPSSEGESEDRGRLTVCISTQSGCGMACSFCATGREGLTRNLYPGEIVDQVLIAQEDLGFRVSNIVAMGQGEPFLNYDNTLAALRIMNAPNGLNIGARRIVVSTCGIITGIERLSHEPEQFTLAVSLHSAQQSIRDKLMPKVASMQLPQLKKKLEVYRDRTDRRVTFEYIMIDGVNDSEKALESLVGFCRGMLCHVNLLPINAVEGSKYQPSSQQTIRSWVGSLEKAGIETTIRNSRGADISGACGQLKNSRK